MHGVRNILVVPDDDPRSLDSLLESAAVAADEAGARVRVLQTRSALQRYEERPGNRFEIEFVGASTTAEQEIARQVRRERADLVLVGERLFRRRSARRRLVRRTEAPVWVVPPVGTIASDVAVAVGPFPESDSVEDHHLHLIETAADLARKRNGRLHVVHAWRLDGETFLRSSRMHVSKDEIAELKNEAAWWARRRLNAAIRRCRMDGVDHEIRLEEGEPEHALSRFVDRYSVRDLVVGSVARTGLVGLAIGNTAERLEFAGNSLLIVPAGSMSERPALGSV